jgi:hypothetical protein
LHEQVMPLAHQRPPYPLDKVAAAKDVRRGVNDKTLLVLEERLEPPTDLPRKRPPCSQTNTTRGRVYISNTLWEHTQRTERPGITTLPDISVAERGSARTRTPG